MSPIKKEKINATLTINLKSVLDLVNKTVEKQIAEIRKEYKSAFEDLNKILSDEIQACNLKNKILLAEMEKYEKQGTEKIRAFNDELSTRTQETRELLDDLDYKINEFKRNK